MRSKTPLSRVEQVDAPHGIPLFVESNTELPLVHFMIGLRTGALFDPADKPGLTRFVARLMRRTAGHQDSAAIEERIDELGGSIGIDVGSTSLLVHGTVISRSLDPFAEILVAILREPGFAPQEFERLRRETTSELVLARDDDRHLARRAFRRRIFGQHPQGRSISGTLRSVGAFEASDVTGQFQSLSGNDKLVVAICGDVSVERARSFVARLGAGSTTSTTPALAPAEPRVPTGRRLVFVDKPERSQTQIFIGGLGTHPRDPDHFALHVANTVFGGTFTARLTEEIRVKRGWSYGAYSSLPYGRFRQPFSLWTFPKATDAAACITLELEMLRTWYERGITKKELASAKRSLIRSHAFAIDTPSKRVGLASEVDLFDLPDDYHDAYLNRIQAITLDEANQAIRQRISPDDLLVSLVGTHAEIGSAIRDAVGPSATEEIVPYDADE